MIEFFDNSESKGIFKDLLCLFSIVINIEIVNIIAIVDMITIVDMIAIVDMIKVVFCDEMLVVINNSLPLLVLI